MALHAALAKVRDAPFSLDAIRSADALTKAAGQDGGPHAVRLLFAAIADDDDQLLAIAALHALGAVFDDGAGGGAVGTVVRPAAVRARARRVGAGVADTAAGRGGQAGLRVAAGGFAAVINQRALRRWAHGSPDHIALALEGALQARDDAAGRAVGCRAGSGAPGVHPALADLETLVAAFPAPRRGLPVALSVGRLHRVKGMATVVKAWASDPGAPGSLQPADRRRRPRSAVRRRAGPACRHRCGCRREPFRC